MLNLVTRPLTAAAVAVAGAGAVAVTPVTAPLPGVLTAGIQLVAGDANDIVIDFVRHGESTDNVNFINGTDAPGAPLTATGESEADATATSLHEEYGNVAGIFASGLIRTQETAAPFAGLENMPVTDLAGLNEIQAGIWDNLQSTSPQLFEYVALTYLLAPMLWTAGLWFVPELGSSDFNGMAFESRFDGAVDTMYNDAIANGTVSDNGQITDVAFSHGGAIMTWVLMNVKNPDLSLMLEHPLTNVNQVVVEGNPTDGWTLESWAGIPVAPADTATQLFVEFRDLMTAPQMASYNIGEALLTYDPTQITSAIQTGFTDVWNEMVQFPQAVWSTLMGAFDSDSASDVSPDVAGSLGDVAAGI